MPSGLKRYQTSGHNHFITFTCYHRFPYLNTDHARTVFEQTLETIRQRHNFYLYGYVLMPNHVHLLLSEPKRHLLSDTLRALKTQTSRQLKGDRKQFWQTRYYDRNIITQTEFVEKLRYIHRNPVEEGFVETPKTGPGAASATGKPANVAAWKSNPTGPGQPARKPASRTHHPNPKSPGGPFTPVGSFTRSSLRVSGEPPALSAPPQTQRLRPSTLNQQPRYNSPLSPCRPNRLLNLLQPKR